MSDDARIEQLFQLLHEYIKTLLGLSSGALVFSVTFVLALLEQREGLVLRPLLYVAWGSWLLSLCGSLMYLLYLIKAAKKGVDLTDFTLVPFGGAGPVHAAAVAQDLHIGRVLVPESPGAFSAFGLLCADVVHDYIRSDLQAVDGGSAYIFEKVGDQWIEMSQLTANDGSPSDSFGWSVDIWGSLAVVGSRVTFYDGHLS